MTLVKGETTSIVSEMENENGTFITKTIKSKHHGLV